MPADAETVIIGDFVTQRVAASPMEPGGVLAVPDAPAGGVTSWASTQFVHGVRREVAELLGLPLELVRVVIPQVGGGFGAKFEIAQALFEHAAFGLDGTPLASSFLSYLVPSAAELPSIDVHPRCTDSPEHHRRKGHRPGRRARHGLVTAPAASAQPSNRPITSTSRCVVPAEL